MSNIQCEMPSTEKTGRIKKRLSILLVGELPSVAALSRALQDQVDSNVRLLSCASIEDAQVQLSLHLDIALVVLLWRKGDPVALPKVVHALHAERHNSALAVMVRSQHRLPDDVRDALWQLGVVDRSFEQPWQSCELTDAVAVTVRNCRRYNTLAHLPALAEAFCSVKNLRDLALLSLQAVHEQGLPLLGGLFCYQGSMAEHRPVVIAGFGDHEDSNCVALGRIADPFAKRMLQTALAQRCSQFDANGAAIYLLTANGYSACLFFTLDGALRPWEKGLLEAISNMIATAIDQSQMAQQLRRSRNATITILSALAEFRDVDTGEHVARVARMTTEIAHLMAQENGDIDAEFLELVGMASILHDTGKIAIPDSILLKPGPLNPEERRTMEQHVIFGYEHLIRASRLTDDGILLSMAADVARHHHERFDGKGYPDGLQGEEIPLSARIVALVDVYDALTCKRPYKQAWPHEKAVALIQAESGQHFDPKVVDAFLRLKALEKTTRYITWTQAMSVGNVDLDSDHRQLISIVNRLWMAHGMGNRQIIEFVIDDLVHYTEFHFAREESMLERVGFADRERHFRIHRNICRRLEEFRWEYFQGIRDEVRSGLLEFVTAWLNRHILEEDMQYSSHFAQTANLEPSP